MPVAKIIETNKSSPLTVIIPSAGVGLRKKTPCMETLPNGELLVNYQISTIRRVYKNSDIVLVVGHESKNVIRSLTEYVRIVENENFLHTNTARSIQLGLQIFPQINNLMVVHGDVFFNEDAIKSLNGRESCLVIDDLEMQNDSAVGILQQENKVKRCTYKDFPKWGHIVYFESKEVKILQKVIKNQQIENLFTEELINRVIDDGGEFSMFSSPKSISIEINRYDAKKLKTTYVGSTTSCRK